jgi:cyclopropane-fatty-acyl-phospholipid synthase
MNRSRLEPLGVPASEVGFSEPEASRHEPSALDRWLVKQITTKLGASPVRIELWDEPEGAARDGIVRMRILDRKALWQLLEAYRYTSKNTAIGHVLARGRKLAPDLHDSKRNIHHHYDIGNEFYKLWLDREALQYTCAYFADPAMTIEQAQQAKMHHVCRKLQLKPGEHVVEAGGGWGGFALFMAKNYGVRVRSFNISKEQIAYSRAWAKQLGLLAQVEFVEDDYRNLTGTFDAFVSIGMLEHVGKGNYKDLGALMNRALTPEGRGLVHSIGRDAPALMNAWIDKRIFPGAYPPSLREMMDLFEPNGLSVLDVENIRLHYAKTLEWWLQRYEENVEAVRTLFDETFVRAWRLYLVGSIAAFLAGRLQLFQVLYARSGTKNVPWTRAHVYRDHP